MVCALALAGREGIPVVQYSPNEVKLAVAGDGAAGKEEVQAMVHAAAAAARGSPPARRPTRCALALCHWWRAPSAPSTRPRSSPTTSSARAIAAAVARRCPMIGSLRGTVLERTATGEVLLEVGGVGYRVLVPTGAMAALTPASPAFVFTHLHVREEAMTLYAFPTRDERDTFEALIGATGVGPKLALAMLSVHTPNVLRRAVLDDDRAALTLVPGVGPRTAQRLLIELKSRLDVPDLDLAEVERAPSARAEVRAALTGLGYAPDEVRDALSSLEAEGTVEDLLREALKTLAVART